MECNTIDKFMLNFSFAIKTCSFWRSTECKKKNKKKMYKVEKQGLCNSFCAVVS